jgi:hypothetical protein
LIILKTLNNLEILNILQILNLLQILNILQIQIIYLIVNIHQTLTIFAILHILQILQIPDNIAFTDCTIESILNILEVECGLEESVLGGGGLGQEMFLALDVLDQQLFPGFLQLLQGGARRMSDAGMWMVNFDGYVFYHFLLFLCSNFFS